ncbi:BT4734/BF3469 family protein [uncultured Bacteroides sp.]|uniref:BT4734/BF3469 family protein n=1 Tax=uncultured Bacteroides sp. TaxID=162156 RepID=UPI002AAC2A70|nr:BT4734/BF3469 family protein [uncultured Bacteroides sp.]
MKVTQFKGLLRRETQRNVKLSALMENIKAGTEEQLVINLRHSLQYVNRTVHCTAVDKLPKLCFAAEFKKADARQEMIHYNGVVLLEIDRLAGVEEAEKVRDEVGRLPHTLAAFVGSSGKSVKLLVSFIRPDGSLPQTETDAELFHAHAYRKAVRFYEELISYKVTLKRPSLNHCCRYSCDSGLFFNPETNPILMKQPCEVNAELINEGTVPGENDSLLRLMPGQQYRCVVSSLFESSLQAVYEEIGGFPQEGDIKPFLVALAGNCFKSGVPEEDAVKGAMLHFDLFKREMELRLTVHNVYLGGKNFGGKPCLTAEQQLAVKTEEFMNRRYEFRHNTQTTGMEYRERNSFVFDFRSVTQRVLNSIALNAQKEGIQLWDRDVTRYIFSDRTPLFAPIEDYLFKLPAWDGKDRIRLLADAVPCENKYWRDFFHRWFLCMVAHWQGMNKQYANSTSPLLVGKQGYKKSTFCLSIVPPELREYYTDSIDFGSKRDAELYLNRFALISIDEFDQITVGQQAFLKHILQKPVVKTRKPNQSVVQELRRYASFIATSNHYDLLTDTSGGRRYICIEVTDIIKIPKDINYEQLYAQAVSEIQSGERYWFDTEDEAVLMAGNEKFEVQPPAEQLFLQYYRAAGKNEPCEKLLASDILIRLQKKSGFKLSATKITTFGRILSKLQIPQTSSNKGRLYNVVEC